MSKKKYTAKQKKWCKFYEETTGFEPLMSEFESGNESFEEAAKSSVSWFEDFAADAMCRLSPTITDMEQGK